MQSRRLCRSGKSYYRRKRSIPPSLPLLRESERDKLGLVIRTVWATLSHSEKQNYGEKYPLALQFYKSYLKRVVAMAKEAEAIEEALINAPAMDQQGYDLRQGPDFERADKINMFVDPSLRDLVRKIITDREKDFQYVAGPQPKAVIRRARPARGMVAGVY